MGIGSPAGGCTDAAFGIGSPTGGCTDADFGIGSPTGGCTDADFGIGVPAGGCTDADFGIGTPAGGFACPDSLAISTVLRADALDSVFAFSRATFAATVAGFTETFTSFSPEFFFAGAAFTIFVSVVFLRLCRIIFVIAFASISGMELLWLLASIPIPLIFSSSSLLSISSSFASSYTFTLFDISPPHSSFMHPSDRISISSIIALARFLSVTPYTPRPTSPVISSIASIVP